VCRGALRPKGVCAARRGALRPFIFQNLLKSEMVEVYELFVEDNDDNVCCLTEDLTYGGISSQFGKGTKSITNDPGNMTLTVETCFNITWREKHLYLNKKNKEIDRVQKLIIPKPRGEDSDEEDEGQYDEEDTNSWIQYGDWREIKHISEEGREVIVVYWGRHYGEPRITKVIWKGLLTDEEEEKDGEEKEAKVSNREPDKNKVGEISSRTRAKKAQEKGLLGSKRKKNFSNKKPKKKVKS